MDQCKHCQLRGDMVKCYQEDCTTHDSWYVKELSEHIKELTKQLQKTTHNSKNTPCPYCGEVGIIMCGCFPLG